MSAGRLHSPLAIVLALLAAWGLPAGLPAHAQVALTTRFERDVNRYGWASEVAVAQRVAGWRLTLANRFRSDSFLLADDRLSFRDEEALTWRLARDLGTRVEARLQGQASWFSLSRVFSQEAYAALRYHVHEAVWVEPAVGFAWDRRPGVATADTDGAVPLRLDAGPAYGLRVQTAQVAPGGYRLQAEGGGTWHLITPRRGRALELEGSAERAFEQTRLRVDLRAAGYRRDAYQATSFLNRGTSNRSETIEATTSDTLLTTLSVETPLPRNLRLFGRVDLALNERVIRNLQAPEGALFFDTDFDRRSLTAEAGVQYAAPRLDARLAARTGAEVEQRRLDNRADLPVAEASQKATLLRQADYDEGAFTLLARLQTIPLQRLTVTFDGTASILRHDTPDINPDDRDEVYHSGQLGLRWQWSPVLETSVHLLGTFYHTVYLRAERSAENNRQRSLRFRPAVQWTPSPRTTMRLTSEVRATYTVDDFVLPGRRPNDQSARELRYSFALEQDLRHGVRLLADGGFSDLRLGRLLWEAFAEIPSDTLRTYSGWLRLRAGQRLTAEIGLRAFIRSDFDRATSVRYPAVDEAGAVRRDDDGAILYRRISRPGRTWIEQIGPTCALAWPMPGGSRLRLDGWLNLQRVHHRLYGALPEAAADRIRRAARRGSRTLIPNLMMTVDWRF
ncbi:MAG: hypothetical protein D6685_11660 [Bacteroidetes bacterium]|nr:MAG: hypothetical protein D6685_11660 [Bacteroidota bacterium]